MFHPFIQRSLGVINLELTLFPWLHLYEGLSFGVGVAVVEVVVVVVEGVAPETVAAEVRVRSRFFDQVGHETMYASS